MCDWVVSDLVKKKPIPKKISQQLKQPVEIAEKVVLFDKSLVRIGIPIVFFIGMFLFLIVHIDPSVIYSNNGFNTHSYVSAMQADSTVLYKDPWFQNLFILELTPQYFQKIASTPGGWTKFAATCIIYSCNNTFSGAALITAIASVIFMLFALYIKKLGAKDLYFVHYAPIVFILLLCARYELRSIAFLLPIAGALLLALLYHNQKPASLLKKMVWLLPLFCLSWYLTHWGCLFFLVFVLIDEFSNKQRVPASTIVLSIVSVGMFFLVETLLSLDKVMCRGDFISCSGLVPVMIVFFPVAAIVVSLVNRSASVQDEKKKYTEIIRAALFACGIVATGAWICMGTVNRHTRTIARTVHHIIKGKWDAILNEKITVLFSQFPQKAGPLQLFMIHAVNQALCRTGQAGEKLFTFPQASFNYDPLLMIESTLSSGVVNWIAALELSMDLGMINSAEKIAGELMETMGPYPEIVYRRALIQIARDNYEAAAVYLNRLSHMPFYRKEAKRLLDKLNSKEILNSQPRLVQMHTCRDTIDYFLFNGVSHDELLRNLLQSNSGNKLAYDYLMSYCLLSGRLDDIPVYVQFAHTFGYQILPQYWEEALCLNHALHAQKNSSEISFSGLRQETVNRFYTFTQSWLQMEKDPDAAIKLAPSYGDTFFYFSMFRYSRGGSR